MDDALLTLSQWLSPAFPVGGFAYSHGLEWAVAAGEVSDAGSVRRWLGAVIAHGSGASDATLLCRAMDDAADHPALDGVARALCPAAERWLETCEQGVAFTATVNALTGRADPPAALPVAVGRAAAVLDLPQPLVAALYLQGFAANLAGAAVRLVPLGQTVGQEILASLRPSILEVAERAARTPLDEIANAALGAEHAAMSHETQPARLFRS